MPGDVLGSAFIEIVPHLAGFETKAKSGVESAMRGVNTTVDRAGKNIDERFKTTGASVSKSMSDAGARGGTALSSHVRKSTEESGRHFGDLRKRVLELGVAFGAGFGVTVVVGKLREFVAGAREAAAGVRITEQVIRSTGGVANVTADSIDRLTTSIGNNVGVDDDVVRAGTNLLLTFTSVRNEVGRGNDIFDQATGAVVDLAAAMNSGVVTIDGVKGASIQLGKALNDPIKGISALSRVGVSFTEQQKEQIKTLVASGKTLDAQKIILAELGKEFGGAAAAASDPIKKLGAIVDNAGESFAAKLLPAVNATADFISTRAIPAISHFVDQMHSGEGAGGAFSLTVNTLKDDVTGLAHVVGDVLGPTLHVAQTVLGGVFGLISSNATVFTGLVTGIVAFVAASKTIAVVTAAYQAFAGRGGVLDGLRLRAMYAADGMRNLAAGENAAKLGALGMNLALGAVGLIVGALAMRSMKAKQAQEEHSAAVESFSQVLRDNNGAINANVTAQRAAELQQKGLLDLANKIGINLATYTQATLGNADAQRVFGEALRDSKDAGSLTFDEFQKLAVGTAGYTAVTKDAGIANKNLAAATDATKGSTEGHTQSMEAAKLAAKAEADSLDKLWTSLTKIANVNLSAQSANIAFHQAIIALDTSLKGLDGTTKAQTLSLNVNTKAGADARSQLVQNIQTAIADGEAQKSRGVSVQRATKWTQDDIAALRTHYINLGYNKAAVDAVIKSIGNLAVSKANPKVDVNTAGAKGKISALQADINRMHGKTVVSTFIGRWVSDVSNWTIPRGAPNLAGLNAAGGYIDGPGTRGVDSQIRGVAPGEFIVNDKAVAEPGARAFLERWNATNDFAAAISQVTRGATSRAAGQQGELPGTSAPITIMPGAVQVVLPGSTDQLDPRVIHDVVLDALHQLIRELKTGGRR